MTIAALIYNANKHGHVEFYEWLKKRKNRKQHPASDGRLRLCRRAQPRRQGRAVEIKGRRVVVYGKVGLRAEEQIRMLKEEWRRSVYDEMDRTVDRPDNYDDR